MLSTHSATDVGVLPFDRLGGLVVLVDVVEEFAPEVGGGGEDAAVDEIALDLGEPEFDLVEPGRVGGREVKTHVGVVSQELLDSLGFVGREVVEDDVDLEIARLSGDQRAQEGNELSAGVVRSCLPEHLSGLGVERGVQGEGPTTDVLETMALGPARRKRQHRIAPVKRLDGGLLVQAEYDG